MLDKAVMLSIRVTEEDKETLSALAATEDRSEAAVIRLAIREYAERHPPTKRQPSKPRPKRAS